MSLESVLRFRHSWLILFVHLPQLSTVSLFEINNEISQIQNVLLTCPRSHSLRPLYLLTLSVIRSIRYDFSDESGDLDKSISHFTEAILLLFHPPIEHVSDVIEGFFHFAKALLLRSQKLKQPDDVKHAIKYLRYLQDRSFKTSNITRGQIEAFLVQALAVQAGLESVDPIQDIREAAILCRKLLTSGVSESLLIHTVKVLAEAMYMTIAPFGQPPPDEAIECMREARIPFPHSAEVGYALVTFLFFRFIGAYSHDDYEEAMSILGEMITDPNENADLAMGLAASLAWSRFTFDGKPEHSAEAISRIRALLDGISSEHPYRANFTEILALLKTIRFDEFGVTGDRPENNTAVGESYLTTSLQMEKSNLVEFPLPMPEKGDPRPHVHALRFISNLTDLTDIEKAIDYCRLCLTSPHSYRPLTLITLGNLLYRLFHLTSNIDYLNEAITVYRDVIRMPGVSIQLPVVALSLSLALLSRFKLFKGSRDRDEITEVLAIVATDTSTDVSHRFRFSCLWTHVARSSMHPVTLTAYETAMSLMQESLSFAPNLEIQHFRLVAMRDEYQKLPLNYASYLVQIGELKQAIETLERGRGLLWSEMRGFRASIDQLRAVNLPLAEKFADVNRDLEALTISGSSVIWMEDGQVSGHGAMDPVGRLVVKQRKLVQERDGLISQIRAQPGFDTFLIPSSFDTLRSAAAGGPVILINYSKWCSDIIILLHDSPPSLIPTSDDFYDRAKGLHDKLLGARNSDSDLESGEFEDTLRYVLEKLYDLVGRPVIQRLNELSIPQQSRVWWCPTSVFCSLPLHAMGPIRSDGHAKLYFSDLYIPSYTPTLSALIESRKTSTQALDAPSVLLVVQPDAQIPSSLKEMYTVRTVCPTVEILSGKKATPISTLDRLREHRFAHISCHGVLETGKPFDTFFKLYEGAHLTLLDIARSRLPTAEFAFLSACHTAEITEESIADEGLHLAAAVQYSGFRSVVGTMWAMADIDGPVLAESFYQSVFSEKCQGVPYHERTADALRDAVRNLRRKKKMTLERWVNYVHYGA